MNCELYKVFELLFLAEKHYTPLAILRVMNITFRFQCPCQVLQIMRLNKGYWIPFYASAAFHLLKASAKEQSFDEICCLPCHADIIMPLSEAKSEIQNLRFWQGLYLSDCLTLSNYAQGPVQAAKQIENMITFRGFQVGPTHSAL